MSPIISQVQVNIPFRMLVETHLDRFVKEGLNPEIGLDAEALDRYEHSDFKGVADELRAAGATITVHAPFMDLSPGSPDPRIRAVADERFEQALAVIPLFQPVTMVCHAGFSERRYGHMRDLWLEHSLAFWARVCERLSAAGAMLMIENVYEADPEDLQPLFESLDAGRVGFCLDTGHQSAFGHRALEDWLNILEPYLGQVHLHDNQGARDDHLAVGSGGIDFDKLFNRLARMGRRPLITLEPHREEDLAPSLAYLERVWPWRGA